MELEFSRQILEKYTITKFHKNPSSEGQIVPSGRTEGQTDVRKLIVTSRNFMDVPKNYTEYRNFFFHEV